MTRKTQPPTRSENKTSVSDYVEEHPAYAMIGASRVESTGAALAGSDFLHNGYISIRIAPAKLERGLSADHWYASGRRYIEVEMSFAQWATFVSTLNVGDGIPCTLDWIDNCGVDPGPVPGIQHEPGLRRTQLNDEVIATLRDALDKIAAIREKVTPARQRELDLVTQEIVSNLPFVASSFDKHAETTIEKAKIEAEAYLTGALLRAGMSAISSPITIESGVDEREARLARIEAVYPEAAEEARRAGRRADGGAIEE